MRVGNRLAEILIENGVEYVFGVPGGQTLPRTATVNPFMLRRGPDRDAERMRGAGAARAVLRASRRTGTGRGVADPGAGPKDRENNPSMAMDPGFRVLSGSETLLLASLRHGAAVRVQRSGARSGKAVAAS